MLDFGGGFSASLGEHPACCLEKCSPAHGMINRPLSPPREKGDPLKEDKSALGPGRYG